jgi:hypothetical protein
MRQGLVQPDGNRYQVITCGIMCEGKGISSYKELLIFKGGNSYNALYVGGRSAGRDDLAGAVKDTR